MQLKTGGELFCSGRVSSSCSTNITRRFTFVTHPVISHECGKDPIVIGNLSLVICDTDMQPNIASYKELQEIKIICFIFEEEF
jgi:hypothetical protein